MENLQKMKKNFTEDFEVALSLEGQKIIKELENKYLYDVELTITNSFNICSKLVKMDISPEDKKKCEDFLRYFYYLDEMKSI